jgi:hypothetical protein
MRGTTLYGPCDVRYEERAVPTIIKPTDNRQRPRPRAGLTCGNTAA